MCEFGRTHFFSTLRAQFQHFNLAALGMDEQRGLSDFDHLTRFPHHVRVAACRVFAAVEDRHTRAGQLGPGARRGVAGADQVVHLIDMIGPMDLSLVGFEPSLVTRLRFILRDFLVPAGYHQISGLQQGADTQRKQGVEVHICERVIGTDRASLLQEPSVGRKMVRPVSRSPRAIGQLMEEGPR